MSSNLPGGQGFQGAATAERRSIALSSSLLLAQLYHTSPAANEQGGRSRDAESGTSRQGGLRAPAGGKAGCKLVPLHRRGQAHGRRCGRHLCRPKAQHLDVGGQHADPDGQLQGLGEAPVRLGSAACPCPRPPLPRRRPALPASSSSAGSADWPCHRALHPQVDYELAPGSLRSAKEIFPASLVRRCGLSGSSLAAAGWNHAPFVLLALLLPAASQLQPSQAVVDGMLACLPVPPWSLLTLLHASPACLPCHDRRVTRQPTTSCLRRWCGPCPRGSPPPSASGCWPPRPSPQPSTCLEPCRWCACWCSAAGRRWQARLRRVARCGWAACACGCSSASAAVAASSRRSLPASPLPSPPGLL